LANLDEFDVDASNNNIDESHMASDELQVAFETVVLFIPKRSMVFPMCMLLLMSHHLS
jgi:hypothetical protein